MQILADAIGCELCNYHGTCYYKANEDPTCECFQWYAGEFCQINLKGKISPHFVPQKCPINNELMELKAKPNVFFSSHFNIVDRDRSPAQHTFGCLRRDDVQQTKTAGNFANCSETSRGFSTLSKRDQCTR